jgi:RNA polymerase sigma-70 factor, ECF subfamily
LKRLPFQSRFGRQSHEQSVCGVLLGHLDALYSAAHRLTKRADLAEDLVQETARKALEGLPGLRDERNIRGWLFKILFNSLRDHLRRSRLWEELDPEDEELEPGTDVEGLSRATAQDVQTAIDQLSPARRAIVILIDIEEFTIVEAAGILRIPPGTVASRLARAHCELRDRLRAYRSRSIQGGGEG